MLWTIKIKIVKPSKTSSSWERAEIKNIHKKQTTLPTDPLHLFSVSIIPSFQLMVSQEIIQCPLLSHNFSFHDSKPARVHPSPPFSTLRLSLFLLLLQVLMTCAPQQSQLLTRGVTSSSLRQVSAFLKECNYIRTCVITYIRNFGVISLWQSRETLWWKWYSQKTTEILLELQTGVAPQIWKYLILFSVDGRTVWFFLIRDERNSTLLSSLKGPLTFQHPQLSISVWPPGH